MIALSGARSRVLGRLPSSSSVLFSPLSSTLRFLFLFLFLLLFGFSSSGARVSSYSFKDGLCKNTGQEPHKASLTFCDRYRAKTCCLDDKQMLVHHVEMQRLNTSQSCSEVFSRFECSKCDYRNLGEGLSIKGGSDKKVGRQKACEGFAELLYEKCRSDFFVETEGEMKLAPCKSSDAICAQLSEFATNAKEAVELMGAEVVKDDALGLGKRAGIGVEEDDDEEEEEMSLSKRTWCFDGALPPYLAGSSNNRKKTSSSRNSSKKGKSGFSKKSKRWKRWKRIFMRSLWLHNNRLAKFSMAGYFVSIALFFSRRYSGAIRAHLLRRRIEKMRSRALDAAQRRAKEHMS